MKKLTYSNRCSSLELGLVVEAESHLIFIINHVNDLKPSKGFNLKQVQKETDINLSTCSSPLVGPLILAQFAILALC